MRNPSCKMIEIKSKRFFKFKAILLFFIFCHGLSSQTFHHCPDIIGIGSYNIKFVRDRIMFRGLDTLVIGAQNDFDCGSNTLIDLPNIRLVDFYPINDREFLMIDDYTNLIIYDIISKEIKRVVMTQEDGMYEIRRYKSSTYISGYYGKYYVNNDDLTSDTWHEVTIPLPTEGSVFEMEFITDDFFVFGLSRDEIKGGVAITQDGGANWSVDTTGFEFKVSGVEYVGNNNLVVIDNGGSVYISNDMGETWMKKKIHPEFTHSINSEVVGNDIYIIGGNIDETGNEEIACLFKSVDYGHTWQQIFESDENRVGLSITKDEQNRLYFTTFDGSVFYTKESVSAAHEVVMLDISIQPNPVSETFRIATSTGTDRYTAQIRDLNGKVRMTLSEIYPDTDIDVSSLRPGIYIVQGKSGDGRAFVQKLVKTE